MRAKSSKQRCPALCLIKKLFLAKRRKINELPYELHYVFVMMIAYHKNQPNTITASKNTDKLREISIAYGSW